MIKFNLSMNKNFIKISFCVLVAVLFALDFFLFKNNFNIYGIVLIYGISIALSHIRIEKELGKYKDIPDLLWTVIVAALVLINSDIDTSVGSILSLIYFFTIYAIDIGKRLANKKEE